MSDVAGVELFKASLKAYQIADFDRQILRYHETYRDFVNSKLMSQQELDLSLREGFYFGHPEAGLGEFLSFSALPRLIKQMYPGSKVFVGPNRFSEAVFKNNHFVDGVEVLENRTPFGSQREFGFGTTTQRRLLPIGVFHPSPIGPEMTPSAGAIAKAEQWKAKLNLRGRKLVFMQSSGRTNPKVFSFFKWSRWLAQMRDEFCIVQIGNLRDQFVWAEKVLLKQWNIDEMAAMVSVGNAFVGPNSGVMHLASAVGTNAVVMHNEAHSSEIVFPVLGDNEVLPGKVNHHLFHCYPWHHHVVIDRLWNQDSRFAERATLDGLRKLLREACLRENPTWTSMKTHFAAGPICLLKGSI